MKNNQIDSLSQMRILICDNDRNLLRVVEITLTQRGHKVDKADTVQAALDIFDKRRKSGETYDLIILDVEMPGLGGHTVGGHVREWGYTGRLVFMTAYGPEYVNFADLDAEYWAKPQAMQVLVARVENLPLPPEPGV